MDIQTLSQLGESQTLEYKRNTDSLLSILKSVVAFTNTAGGILLIGVEDNGSILGINEVGKVQEQLANTISDRIKPQIIPSITVSEIEGKHVIALQIDYLPGAHYLSDKGLEKSTYIRVGNSNRLASAEMINELSRAANYSSFDKMPCDSVITKGNCRTNYRATLS